MNYGYIPDEVSDKDYLFGAVGGAIINHSGQWVGYLPTKERQNLGLYETFACVSFTTLNCIEILIRKKYNRGENFSDRFLAQVSDTKNGGNSPRKVGDALRHKGAVKESIWPFTSLVDTFAEYYKDIPSELFKVAGEFNKKYQFKYETVGSNPTSMKSALMRGPLGVSVHGWVEKSGLYVKPEGARDNHFTTCIGYEEGEYWLIFDTYADKGSMEKKVAWDTHFEVVKLYSIIEQEQKRRTDLSSLIKSWFNKRVWSIYRI